MNFICTLMFRVVPVNIKNQNIIETAIRPNPIPKNISFLVSDVVDLNTKMLPPARS